MSHIRLEQRCALLYVSSLLIVILFHILVFVQGVGVGMYLCGVVWSGVEWSGVEWSGVERENKTI